MLVPLVEKRNVLRTYKLHLSPSNLRIYPFVLFSTLCWIFMLPDHSLHIHSWQIILFWVCLVFVFSFEGFPAGLEFCISRRTSIVFLVPILLAEKSCNSFFKDHLSFIHSLSAFKRMYSHMCTVCDTPGVFSSMFILLRICRTSWWHWLDVFISLERFSVSFLLNIVSDSFSVFYRSVAPITCMLDLFSTSHVSFISIFLSGPLSEIYVLTCLPVH